MDVDCETGEKYLYSIGIEDYCLSQTSLEQVFLRFALEQEDDDGSAH